ncbi:MAG: hypothetical protein ACRD20_10745 [Terriglobales bacterium]
MLKKSALWLFGLALMLVCLNPPKANAGVVVAFGPVNPYPVRVYRPRPYVYVAPQPYIAYGPSPYAYPPVYVHPDWRYRPGFYADRDWDRGRDARRFEHREFGARRLYGRR